MDPAGIPVRQHNDGNWALPEKREGTRLQDTSYRRQYQFSEKNIQFLSRYYFTLPFLSYAFLEAHFIMITFGIPWLEEKESRNFLKQNGEKSFRDIKSHTFPKQALHFLSLNPKQYSCFLFWGKSLQHQHGTAKEEVL